jgi:hypothetical protein
MQIDVTFDAHQGFVAITPIGLITALSLSGLRNRIAAVVPNAELRFDQRATVEQRKRNFPSDPKRSAAHRRMWAR